MEIVMRDITELKPYAKNPRKNDRAVAPVAASIKEFGFKVPLVVTKDGEIITGHTRYKAAQQLGLSQVPCIIADDLSEAQARAFRLADNKTAEQSEWDFKALSLEIEELTADDFDLSRFGFEQIADSNEWGTDFTLPDGDKSEFEVMHFALRKEQAAAIKKALKEVDGDVTDTFGNTDDNGNALYELIRQWKGGQGNDRRGA